MQCLSYSVVHFADVFDSMSNASSALGLILIRYGEVEPQWKPIRYRAMDVLLSEHGEPTSHSLAVRIAETHCPVAIYHSGLSGRLGRYHSMADVA